MDQIYKLQPHRTLHLQGFDDYGAAAALCGASDTGFTVSGVFRDMADFAVRVQIRKDDPFGAPLFSLPDEDLQLRRLPDRADGAKTGLGDVLNNRSPGPTPPKNRGCSHLNHDTGMHTGNGRSPVFLRLGEAAWHLSLPFGATLVGRHEK
jgi:hypothetical protein